MRGYFRILVCLLAGVGLVHGEIIAGPRLDSLLRGSVHVMDMHNYAMQTQMQFGEPIWHMAFDFRMGGPVQYQLGNGDLRNGGMGRGAFSVGGGWGQMQKVAFLFGFQGDFVDTRDNWYFAKERNDSTSPPKVEVGQLVSFAGISAGGFLLTGGLMSQRLNYQDHMDINRQLTDYARNEGLGVSYADYNNVVTNNFFVQTRYKEYAGLDALFAKASELTPEDPNAGEAYKMAMIATQFSPWLLITDPQAFLGKALGLAKSSLSLEQLAKGLDPYLEQKGIPKISRNIGYGLRDIAGAGANFDVKVQVMPTPTFRMAQLSWVRYKEGEVIPFFVTDLYAGARASLYRRSFEYQGAVEAFVSYKAEYYKYIWIPAMIWESAIPSITFSYSYNLPDPVMGLPLTKSHCFGVQLVIGNPIMARPSLPLVRDGKSSGRDD